jgi:arabinan endo-1,5-alpha-L-arabinosidase
MFGHNMADTTNNYPIITHSYKFNGHVGWSGNGHCGILHDNGRFFMLHQGRLAPDNLMMVMQVREIFWLPSGWPVVSPERYAGMPQRDIEDAEVAGDWEIISLNEIPDNVKLWQGQIPPGGWTYSTKEFNVSKTFQLSGNHTTDHPQYNKWLLNDNVLTLNGTNCKIFTGWDWENRRHTLLFSGIQENGSSIWGKKVNLTVN